MDHECCHPASPPPPAPSHQGRGETKCIPFLRDKLFLAVTGLLALVVASFFVSLLEPFRASLLMYVRILWGPLAIGFLLGGLIERFVPSGYISKFLARPAKRTVFYAAGLGFLMSACSHGILAIAMELHKKGASGPAVISFLLASPWANLPVTILLVGLFGFRGLLIIVSALIVAVVTGLVFLLLDRARWIETNEYTAAVDEGFSIRRDVVSRWRAYSFSLQGLRWDAEAVARGAASLADMILWWIVIGVALASAIGAYVPSHIFHDWFGPTAMGLFLTLVAATVIEICSEGSAPVAFELYRQTGALGNSFVFLSAGVVTDYTEIGLVGTNLGWRSALWMVLVTVPQVLLLGWVYNQWL